MTIQTHLENMEVAHPVLPIDLADDYEPLLSDDAYT